VTIMVFYSMQSVGGSAPSRGVSAFSFLLTFTGRYPISSSMYMCRQLSTNTPSYLSTLNLSDTTNRGRFAGIATSRLGLGATHFAAKARNCMPSLKLLYVTQLLYSIDISSQRLDKSNWAEDSLLTIPLTMTRVASWYGGTVRCHQSVA
jgi:hypothetical protein